MNILIFLIVAGLAGWLAGLVTGHDSMGFIGSILIGIVGGFLGKFILGLLGVSFGEGIFGSLVIAAGGALVLLFLVGLIKR